MKDQGILPRLSDFPGETGKCRGKFLHMNRPLLSQSVPRQCDFKGIICQVAAINSLKQISTHSLFL